MGTFRASILLTAALPLAACATSAPPGAADYRETVARSLNHLRTTNPPTRYSISAPWTALTGRMMVCARQDVNDGRGGTAPTTNYSMFELDNGRIVGVVQDQTVAGCPNRAYTPLSPI